MTRPIKFGSYVFLDNGLEFQPNIGEVPRVTRLPGVSGGFDEFGFSPSPSEIGNVRFRFIMIASTESAMSPLRDAVKGLPTLGVDRLYIEPYAGATQRWAWARINNITMPEDYRKRARNYQEVTIDFQLSNPRWFSENAEGTHRWGDGHTYGAASALPAIPGLAPTVVSGLSTVLNRTNNGNAIARPRLILRCAAGQFYENPIIERTKKGFVVDQVALFRTITAGQIMEIDCRRLAVKVDGFDAYGADFLAQNPDWMKLEPGVNAIQIRSTNAGSAGTLRIAYYDTWR